MRTTIFCPNCDALILDAQHCPVCDQWERRPAPVIAVGTAIWRVMLRAGLASGLTLADGVLYACDTAGKLHALDAATGDPAWSPPADLGDWRVYRQIAVASGLVIVGPADGRSIPLPDKAVLLLDAATGAVRWRFPLAVRQVSDPLVADETIFVATSDGQAVALALDDGTVRWRSPIAGLYQAAPVAADDLVLFGGDKGILTALHAADGSRAWAFRAEADSQWSNYLPYPPVCADGVLYVTCWNCHCYALCTATGAIIWSSERTKRPPLTPPLVTADRIYFCGHDRFVYCLDRATGKTLWRTQLPRKSPTTPVLVGRRLYVGSEDHHVYALDAFTGELDPLPFGEMARHIVGDWASDGERLYLGDADGNLMALLLQTPREERDPARLEAAGRWAEAAVCYALAGALVRAAEIYQERLHEPRHAALLYERGGAPAQAGALYEQAGEYAVAAEQYRAAGLAAEAARVLALAQRWSEAVELYVEAGDLQQAAELCARTGDYRSAARYYEQAGALLLAADARAKAQEWLRAAELYAAAGDHGKAGEAWLHLGACDRAAESFWRAAQAAQAEGRPAEEVAALYDRATEQYAKCGADDNARECDRLRRWLRKQPLLGVTVLTPEEFTVGESGRLAVVVANVGWGMASDIRLEIRGPFEADTTRANKPFGLGADRKKALSVYIVPLRAGAQLPLHLTVRYLGPGGVNMPPLEETFDLTVREKAERRGESTPQYIVQGNLIQAQQAGEVVIGEKYSVDIVRQAATPPPSSPTPAAPATESFKAPRVVCSACSAEQPADRAKCMRCGMPFARCTVCHYALPERTPFCPHCGAAQ